MLLYEFNICIASDINEILMTPNTISQMLSFFAHPELLPKHLHRDVPLKPQIFKANNTYSLLYLLLFSILNSPPVMHGRNINYYNFSPLFTLTTLCCSFASSLNPLAPPFLLHSRCKFDYVPLLI